jgi:2-polyprenyl-3-methyl-5-hydroxy-6-metoxy-1,4-benzoquinol methylase
MNCREKKTCISCDNKNLIEILDLKNQPLANTYHSNTEILPEFPLKLNLCTDCYHLQLSHIVNPDLLFKNYLYVSGTSKTLRDYFEWFSKFIGLYTQKTKGSILDIACNDGTQLDFFKKNGWETYGVEPATNLFEICSKNHEVVCDYFNNKCFDKKFDVILAQNVFAHNENAKQFLDDCYNLMDDDSLLFIQTSQSEMINNNQFDTIYHEHLSFFNVNSFNELSKRTKLNLIDVVKTPAHGISYVFVLSKKIKQEVLVQNHIDVEKERGLLSQKTYTNYRENVLDIVNTFIKSIEKYREDGYKIIGYGAAAKGMTFLNFANVKLDYIIDDNPMKQGLYTPGGNIQIKSVDFLSEYDENDRIVFIPLAWNFFNEIKERIKKVRDNDNDIYIKYFPKYSVE